LKKLKQPNTGRNRKHKLTSSIQRNNYNIIQKERKDSEIRTGVLQTTH